MKKTYEIPELEVLLFDLREVAMKIDALSAGTTDTIGVARNKGVFFSVDSKFDDDFI